MIRITILLVAVLSATIWAGCGGGDAEQLPDPFFGVAPQAPLTADDFDRIAEAEIDAVREYMHWGTADAAAPSGDYDWSSFDERVAAAAREGVRVLPFLYGTPAWVARGLDGHNCQNCDTFAPRSPKALAAWRDFASAAAERYGPDGSFWNEDPDLPELPIRDWQLWNEQNSPTYYRPRPDAEAYNELLAAGNEGVKEADPDANVVLGGMAELHDRGPTLTGSDFLTRLYEIEGSREHFDAVGVHAYAANPSGVKDEIQRMRDVMEEAGDGEAELWVTEFGWSSERGGHPLNRGPQGQAAQLREIYTYLLENREALNLGGIIWFSWRDTENEICDWCPQSGLVTADLEPKPALDALTEFTQAADEG